MTASIPVALAEKAAAVQWDAGLLVLAGVLTRPACLLGCAAVAYTASHIGERLPLFTEIGAARSLAGQCSGSVPTRPLWPPSPDTATEACALAGPPTSVRSPSIDHRLAQNGTLLMITTVVALMTAHPHTHPVMAVLSQDGVIPNPPPTPLPGNAAGAVQKIVGYIKWVAGLGLAGLFFAGLVAFSAGRVIDHRHYGRVGTMMMICSLGGALLYASGYSMISTFASGQ